MQITEHTTPINHMPKHLIGATHRHLVGAFFVGQGEANVIRLAKFGADTVVKASDRAPLPVAKPGEAVNSRFFRIGEALFLTGDDEFRRLFAKKKDGVSVGENAILGYIESMGRVRDADTGDTAETIHLVGPTEVTLMFVGGRLVDYTAKTGIVICDYERSAKTLYGYKAGSTFMGRLPMDRLNLEEPGRDLWSHVVDGPSNDEPIVSFGRIHARDDGRFVMDVAFQNGKKALLVFGDDDARWSMMREGSFAASMVNFGRPSVLTVDGANRVLRVTAKDNLSRAFREYIATGG